MQYISIRVLDTSGRPKHNARVAIGVNQFLASGVLQPKFTNTDGLVRFELNIDNFAEIEIYIDGKEMVSRGKVKSEYFITM